MEELVYKAATCTAVAGTQSWLQNQSACSEYIVVSVVCIIAVMMKMKTKIIEDSDDDDDDSGCRCSLRVPCSLVRGSMKLDLSLHGQFVDNQPPSSPMVVHGCQPDCAWPEAEYHYVGLDT